MRKFSIRAFVIPSAWPLLLCLAVLAAPSVHAGPGAHGPDGEHLDAPAGVSPAGAAVPRLETSSETFELVARLHADELSVLIDRFETNEPVLDARVEVELSGVKAAAQFHSDHGDYAVTDERLLQALAQPGAHAMLFTVFAGDESDLLTGTLEQPLPHEHESSAWSPVAAVPVAGVVAAIAFLGVRRWRGRRQI